MPLTAAQRTNYRIFENADQMCIPLWSDYSKAHIRKSATSKSRVSPFTLAYCSLPVLVRVAYNSSTGSLETLSILKISLAYSTSCLSLLFFVLAPASKKPDWLTRLRIYTVLDDQFVSSHYLKSTVWTVPYRESVVASRIMPALVGIGTSREGAYLTGKLGGKARRKEQPTLLGHTSTYCVSHLDPKKVVAV